MTRAELDQLLTLLKSHRVAAFAQGELRIEFHPSAFTGGAPSQDIPPEFKDAMPDDETMLYASSEGLPDAEDQS